MNKKPILLATLGYPGSGKTFFARRLAEERRIFHLSSDRMHLTMFPNPLFNAEENERKFGVMDYIAEELLKKGISVIYDANSAKVEHRKRLNKIAQKTNTDFLLIWFKTPLEIAKKRIKDRQPEDEELAKYFRNIDEEVLLTIKKMEEYPSGDEKYVVVEGTKPFEEQIKVLEKYLP